jgi:hypothetical protein
MPMDEARITRGTVQDKLFRFVFLADCSLQRVIDNAKERTILLSEIYPSRSDSPPRPRSMPRLPAPPPLNTVIDRSTTNTTKALQVICAFPLSGQYGPGSRFLYVEIHYPSSRRQ